MSDDADLEPAARRTLHVASVEEDNRPTIATSTLYENWLWAGRVDRTSSWGAVARYLVHRLRDHLALEIVASHSMLVDEGFSCRLRGVGAFGGCLQLEWRGHLGVEILRGRPSVTALLKLFSQERRLGIVGHRASSFQLAYVAVDGRGQWTDVGWEDDYGDLVDDDL